MQHKRSKYLDNEQYPSYEYSIQSPSQPVKSPSPDKKRSKLITPTKSPQVIDIKRNLAQSRLEDRKVDKTPVASKPHDQSTRYYTNEDFQEYRSSHKKNEIFQQLQNMLPEQFTVDSHMYRSATNHNSKQLDYIKLLQQKQKTIKQLHEIIEMINRNNSLELSTSSVSNSRQKKIFDNTGILSKSPTTHFPNKQLKNQVRILTIQNQQLIHMIQKINQDKKTSENLQKSLIKQKIDYNAHKMKQEILSLQIYQMKESLLQKDQNCNALIKQNKDLYSKYIQLDQQNQKLIKMMKDKELSDRKYHNSLIESNISQKSNISQSHAKEKVSIQKIKQQYNQSLKIFKDTVYGDVEDFMREIETSTMGLQKKIKEMEEQIQTLEKFKSAYDNLRKTRVIDGAQSQGERAQDKGQKFKYELHEISQVEAISPEKEHYREIESLLMEKNELYEKQLSSERNNNQELAQELQDLKARYETLQNKYLELMQQNYQMGEKNHSQRMGEQNLRISQSPQRMRKSPQRNVQIQEINQAKSRQAEIQKLSQLIQKCQTEFTEQKNNLLAQIQSLRHKNESYQQIIQSQRQEFEQKQNDVQTRISDKQNELKRNESVYKSQIDHLKQLLSEKSIQQEHSSQLEKLKQSLQLKQVQIQQKTTETVQLKQKLQQLEETQQFAKQQIKKLVDNYETEITILKGDKLSQKQKLQRELQSVQNQVSSLRRQLSQVRHQVQTRQKVIQTQNSEIKRLLNQSQNSQLLLSQTETQSRQQIYRLKQLLQQLQRQLNAKNRESRQLLHSKQALQVQHSELKQHIEQLLVISGHVEQIQLENKTMRQTILGHESSLNRINSINQQQLQRIDNLEQQNQTLNQQLHTLTRQKQQKQQTIHQLQSNNGQLQSSNSQLQQQINELQQHKNDLQQQISDLQQHINQLERQLNNLNSRVSLVRKQSEEIIKQNQGIKQQNIDILNQNQSILKLTQNQLAEKDFRLTQQIQKSQQQKAQYQLLINQLKKQNSHLNSDIQILRQENLLYYQTYNQLIYLKQNNILPQLYQLRSLVNTQLNKTLSSESNDKDTHYDLGKLHIDYQSKIDENLLLHSRIHELNSEAHKFAQEKILLQQKIHFLQKNILIYQNQLKQRKAFCEKIINDNNKIEKQLLLIKKLKLQSKQIENDSLRLSLLDRVNHLVRIEQSRDSTIKRISEKQSESPIRKINSLISKVEEFDTFSMKPSQKEPHQ